MSFSARSTVRGACPGVLRPMASGDGLIVRVRPRAATLTLDQARTLAEAARRFGNGHIDLTRRANVQVRGVSDETLPDLQEMIQNLGLLDVTPEAEAVRNILVSPLAGVDPGEVVDVRPIAHELERLIAADAALWRLPPKFGFLIDGGGALTLAAERADIRLEARHVEGRTVIAVGIDLAEGPRWLGVTNPETAPSVAVAAARTFIETQPSGSRRRLRDAGDVISIRLRDSIACVEPLTLSPIEPLADSGNPLPHTFPSSPRRRGCTQASTPSCIGVVDRGLRRDGVRSTICETRQGRGSRIGVLTHESRVFAGGVAAPFGRVEANMLLGLADAADVAGCTELRLSPWRILYLPLRDESHVERLVEAQRALGFIVEAADPVLRIEACPGAPACRSAQLETRAAAVTVARLLPRLEGISRVHVSGCRKGCACSAALDLVLTGEQGRFAVIRNGRADGAPEFFLRPSDVGCLPEILRGRAGGALHG